MTGTGEPTPDDATPGGDAPDGPDGGGGAVDEHAELLRLRAEVEALRAEEAGAAPSRARRRGRWAGAVVLLLLGSLLVPPAIAGTWLRRAVTDTDRWVETVAPLARDRAIQDAVARRVTETIFERVDVESEIAAVLPDRATVLAAPISSGIRTLTGDVVQRIVRSDRFAELWDAANRLAHEQVVDVLTVANGERGVVSVDLSGVLGEAVERLERRGVPFVDRVDPSSASDIELFRSEEVAQLQSAFGFFDRLATLLPWLAVALLVAGALVAPDRRRGGLWAFAGLGGGAGVILFVLATGRGLYLGALPAGASVPANEAIFDTMVRFLRAGARLVAAVGLVGVVAMVVAGPSRAAVALREGVGRAGAALGTGARARGWDPGPVPTWVARNAAVLRGAVVVVALVVFLSWNRPTGAVVVWLALAALAGVGLVSVVARIGQAEPAPAGAGAPVAVASGGGSDDTGASVP